jgi:deoxycytidylate deaminase
MIYNCAYEGIRTKNTTIVCTLSPCVDCLRAAFQSGVKFIVFEKLYNKFPNTDFYTKLQDVHVYVQKLGNYILLEMVSKKEAEPPFESKIFWDDDE